LRNIDAKDGNGLSDEITFQIQINLKNDNGPTRVNDNVLSVVTNGIKEPVNLKVIFSHFSGRILWIFGTEIFELKFLRLNFWDQFFAVIWTEIASLKSQRFRGVLF